jgi:hypothetical protein
MGNTAGLCYVGGGATGATATIETVRENLPAVSRAGRACHR